ncbi:RcnB family protein [Sphingorhabdus sp.]|uniref:RcnB family protein n=1 Tax=Sphingorhabdus sp. TaxID=1902408 RepID=UPI00391AEDC6
MKKFILMTLVTATALSPIAAHAAEIAPVNARTLFDEYASFQREDRRAERQEARGNRTPEQRAERRAARQQSMPQRTQSVPVPAPVAPVVYRAQQQRDNVRVERQQDVQQVYQQRDGVRTERREASQDGRYYDRNRDGNLDRRWDQNRDGQLDRNWDRNRDGRLDRSLDRNDDERVDRRYDQNRNGDLDRRVDRNNDYRLDRQQAGRWTNNWRNDRRYDWRSYRDQNRNYYRPGRYYSPYRDRSYSRISIGFSLGSGYYGSRYWINDPWQYRLPAAYGPYRWVRYYDDVLLVDLRNGRVVDVIRDFFW